MKNIWLQMTLALSTFLIGISSIAFWAFAFHPKIALSSSILVISDNTIEQPKTNQLDKPESNENDIDIEYGWSLIGVESLDGNFYVKNNTGQVIRYLANDFGQNSPFWIKQNGKTKVFKPPYIDGVREQELKPNESIIFSVSVPQNEKPFEAGFNFQVGNERKEKIIWIKVKKQLKSSGLSCNDEIMKAGGILSKTCITKTTNPY